MVPRLRSSGPNRPGSSLRTVKTRNLKWSLADWRKLIRLYRSQEVLWDADNPMHSVKSRRKFAVLNILRGMERSDLAATHIHELLSSLKGKYSKHLRNQLESFKRGLEMVPEWSLFNPVDEFLRPVICKMNGWEDIVTDSSTETNADHDVVSIENLHTRERKPPAIYVDAVDTTHLADPENLKAEANKADDFVVNVSQRDPHVVDLLDVETTNIEATSTVESLSPLVSSSVSSRDEKRELSGSRTFEVKDADEAFCSHLRYLLRQVPHGRPKIQMYLDIQQLVMRYL